MCDEDQTLGTEQYPRSECGKAAPTPQRATISVALEQLRTVTVTVTARIVLAIGTQPLPFHFGLS